MRPMELCILLHGLQELVRRACRCQTVRLHRREAARRRVGGVVGRSCFAAFRKGTQWDRLVAHRSQLSALHKLDVDHALFDCYRNLMKEQGILEWQDGCLVASAEATQKVSYEFMGIGEITSKILVFLKVFVNFTTTIVIIRVKLRCY